MFDINLDDYELEEIVGISLCETKNHRCFIDITVEDNHSFYIVGKNNKLYLSHNCDAQHIKSLLLNMFYKFWPELFSLGIIHVFETPLAKVDHKKTRTYFYTLEDFENWRANHQKENFKYTYLKGLGSSLREDWKEYFSDVRMDKCLKRIKIDEGDEQYFDLLFNRINANKRKDWLGIEQT